MEELGSDNTVRTDETAVAALDAKILTPRRNRVGHVALFPLRRTARIGAIDGQLADREIVAMPAHHLRRYFLHKVRCLLGHDSIHRPVADS